MNALKCITTACTCNGMMYASGEMHAFSFVILLPYEQNIFHLSRAVVWIDDSILEHLTHFYENSMSNHGVIIHLVL